MDIDNMDLGQLFAVADAIGDKYLTDDEIAARDAEMLALRVELWGCLTDADLDEV